MCHIAARRRPPPLPPISLRRRFNDIHTHLSRRLFGIELLHFHFFPEQDAQQGNDDDFTVVVGQRVSAPTTTASAYAVRVPPDAGNNNNNNIPVATAQPSSTHPAPLLSHSSGTWTMPGTGTSGGASSGGGFGRSSRSGGGGRPRSGGGGNGGGGRAMTTDSTGAPFPTMTHTGTQNVPGCGTASSTGGRRFGEDAARAAEGGGGVALSRSGSGKGAAQLSWGVAVGVSVSCLGKVDVVGLVGRVDGGDRWGTFGASRYQGCQKRARPSRTLFTVPPQRREGEPWIFARRRSMRVCTRRLEGERSGLLGNSRAHSLSWQCSRR